MDKKLEEAGIEELFTSLDDIVESLEESDIPLEEALKRYEEGIRILQSCNEKIDAVEKKMLVLTEDGELEEF